MEITPPPALSLPASPTACSVLTPKLAVTLQAFNDLTRALRAAGVQVLGLNLLTTTILIDAAHVGMLCNTFGKDMRLMLSKTQGSYTRHRTTVHGMNVVWLSKVLEQEQ